MMAIKSDISNYHQEEMTDLREGVQRRYECKCNKETFVAVDKNDHIFSALYVRIVCRVWHRVRVS